MKYMRQTWWEPDTGRPKATMVACETDFKEDLHIVAHKTRLQPFQGAVDIEIFECDGDLLQATLEATRRSLTRLEQTRKDQDAMHDWAVYYFTVTAAGGVISTTQRGPLSVEEIKPILQEVAKHRFYRSQRVLVYASDMRIVRMQDGKINVVMG